MKALVWLPGAKSRWPKEIDIPVSDSTTSEANDTDPQLKLPFTLVFPTLDASLRMGTLQVDLTEVIDGVPIYGHDAGITEAPQ